MQNNSDVINEIIEKLRQGKISGKLQLIIDNQGDINNILIEKLDDKRSIEAEIEKVKLKGKKLENVDFSNLNLSQSNFSGLSLRGSNFSDSKIINSNMSYTDLNDTNFYKARISQTDMSNSYGVKDLSSAYMTGSVNLYNVQPSGSPFGASFSEGAFPSDMTPDDMNDINRILIHKKNY